MQTKESRRQRRKPCHQKSREDSGENRVNKRIDDLVSLGKENQMKKTRKSFGSREGFRNPREGDT